VNDVQEFIVGLLNDLNCNGIKVYSTGNIHCQCPFHRPSRNVTAFGANFIDEDKGYPFNCLKCGENGNLAKLVSFATGRSYKNATKLIKKRITLRPITLKRLAEDMVKLKGTAVKAVGGVGKVQLPPRHPNQRTMLRYMRKRQKQARGVMQVSYIINRYGLYYCGEGRMAGRIIMPIRINGKIVGINDRAVDEKARNKSLHTKGQDYNELLYGLDEAIGKPKCVLVEGAFDLFQGVSAMSGKNALKSTYGIVANMGTKFSDTKMALLIENFEEVLLMFDNQQDSHGDNEGFESSVKWYRELKDYMPVKNITTCYPFGKDPGICTKQQWRKAVGSDGYVPETFIKKMQAGTRLKI